MQKYCYIIYIKNHYKHLHLFSTGSANLFVDVYESAHLEMKRYFSYLESIAFIKIMDKIFYYL